MAKSKSFKISAQICRNQYPLVGDSHNDHHMMHLSLWYEPFGMALLSHPHPFSPPLHSPKDKETYHKKTDETK